MFQNNILPYLILLLVHEFPEDFAFPSQPIAQHLMHRRCLVNICLMNASDQ